MDTRKVYAAFRSYFPRIPARDALYIARAAVPSKGEQRFDLPNATPENRVRVYWRPTEYAREHGAPCGARITEPRTAWRAERQTSQRWVENTERCGLRFVGHCDEVAGRRAIDHQGWFADDFQDTIYRGGVWQLPARDGCAVYVAGYSDPNNDGAALIDFAPIYGERGSQGGMNSRTHPDYCTEDALRQAARAADSIAERAAETEREYRRKWQAARDVEELREEIAEARREHGALAAELKTARMLGASYPKICATLRAALAEQRAEVSRAVRKIRKTIEEYGAEILGPEFN